MAVGEKVQVFRSVGRSERAASIRPPGADAIDPARSSATSAYRRQARSLRLRYAGDPRALQHHLHELSLRHDRENPVPPSQSRRLSRGPSPISAPATPTTKLPPQQQMARAVVDWFSDLVARQIDSQLLNYSTRQSLLKTAERLGIGRFHANLIIAVVQHDAAKTENPVRILPVNPLPLRWTLAAMLAVQLLIAVAAWYAFHGV